MSSVLILVPQESSFVFLTGEADKATRMEVQRLLNKVREMQTQRSDFENQLRTNLQDDDVTKQLVTNQEDMEKFFSEQLNKHKPLVSYWLLWYSEELQRVHFHINCIAVDRKQNI